jgi:L-ascorbate metabolism protein UlaG (beta-lactamase superfamily)
LTYAILGYVGGPDKPKGPQREKIMPNRRRVLQTLAAAATLGAGGWALTGAARGNAYYSGPVSDHFDGTRFFNPGGIEPKGRLDFLRWQLTEPWSPWPASLPSPFPQDRPPASVEGDAVRVAYVGHASFLVQTRGVNILIDPVWAERASPFSFVGPKRVNPPGVAFDDLPKIDCVLVTHNHYDHMDTNTIGRLWQRFAPHIVTPLGNDAILRAAAPDLTVQTVDWDATVDLGGSVAAHVEPSQHWSARGAFDRSHALWASFVLRAGAKRLYCVGDTGFGDGATFTRVRLRHPALTAALLPIGAYEPRWFMGTSHMNPDDAVQALELCGAAEALGHHWGTFRLTNEAAEQPALDLAAALAARSVPPKRFAALRPGEVRML